MSDLVFQMMGIGHTLKSWTYIGYTNKILGHTSDIQTKSDPLWRTSKTCVLGIGAISLVVLGQPDGGSRQVGRQD